MNTKYYKRLELVRVFLCIAILLYHIGILKGGYLAVCSFFVLSGYLGVTSSFNKDKFSFKKYYISRLKKIYIPLLIVVFSSIAIISLFPNIYWLNLKPETNSVLLGYNNFWQLNANLDYFVRHVASPFMHLWYIAILVQFELVFPLIFIALRKIGKKISKIIPCIILLGLGIISYLVFLKTVKDGNLMSAYYGTFTRSFSLLFGLLLGFVHVYYKPIIIEKRKLNEIIFGSYILILFIIFLFVTPNSSFFTVSMLLTTLIGMRLIDYSMIDNKKINSLDKKISSLSKVSYEIYLVQYPVIFLFQNVNISFRIKVFLIIIITVVISYFIHIALNMKKKRLISMVLCLVLVLTSIFGCFKYVTAKDHTKEMKQLEKDLDKNRELIEQKQKEYLEKQKNEQDEWQSYLNDLDNDEEHIKEVVKNLHIVGIGDSIMELMVKNLYNVFPNGYFDGKTNRTERASYDVIDELKDKKILGDVVLLIVGTNGECLGKCKDKLMEKLGDRKVFWVNATNPDYQTFNPSIEKLAEEHDNVHIIDWVTYTKNNPGYLISDRVHPNVKGCKVFAEFIYESIYQQYLQEFRDKKEKKIKEHEENEKKKITFIGNDLLLGVFDYLQEDYSNSEFIIDKDFTYKTLKEKIKEAIKNKTLSHNIVFTFNKKIDLTNKEYKELVELCKDYNIYIVDTNNNIKIDKDNVSIIKFNNREKDYTLVDGIHLTDKGNKALLETINEELKKEE